MLVKNPLALHDGRGRSGQCHVQSMSDQDPMDPSTEDDDPPKSDRESKRGTTLLATAAAAFPGRRPGAASSQSW